MDLVRAAALVLPMMRLILDVNIQVVMAMEGLDSFFFLRSLVEDILHLVLPRPSYLPRSRPLMDAHGLAVSLEVR